ncbi:protein GPR107 isoform X2 [Lycorma delicatula]|uniref:protein GPR107 isoform X2 n=1 Tax=Lycorma delicatula TaxID=130591 RepID=UPI003F516E3B
MEVKYWLCAIKTLLFVQYCYSRIHTLEIKNDHRKYISVSTFGFYKGGKLVVKLKNFHVQPPGEDYLFGFTLDRTRNDAMNPYLDAHQEKCLLQQPPDEHFNTNSAAVVYFILDLKSKQLHVNCSKEMSNLHIYKKPSFAPVLRSKRDLLSDQTLIGNHNKQTMLSKKSDGDSGIHANTNNGGSIGNGVSKTDDDHSCTDQHFPITVETKNNINYYNANFAIYIMTDSEEGLYNLYFHNCPNYGQQNVGLDFTMEIEEKNGGNYLSAGEMPLPALYSMMSVLFLLSGCFWVFIVAKSRHPVFKIHYLMAVLVYLKSLSLLFHAINYHFIQTKGEHVAAWAILYYITHLLKGSVLFITIVLIGTGWTFIKHLLSEKDKKIFMIVIPLQVLANVANIIIDESEEGDIEHRTWLDVFMLVDLLCCGAILFPVVWSIRHLQEASHTDGKAAINLRKLKLFRHFYIMIVCYIYFTRIIIYLLQMTVPFQYEWLDEMFKEMVTYVFFVMTGYKFRPASANPYFQVNLDDDDDDVDIVVSHCGVTEGLSKLSRVVNTETTEEEKENLLFSKRESSHEYD